MILGVADLDVAAERLRREHGLTSLPGGRHPTGTVNRVVPLEPPEYLELLAGGWVTELVAAGDRFVGWCVLPDDIDVDAARLGLAVEQSSVERPDGTTLTYRYAATGEDDGLPFLGVADEDPAERRARFRRMFEDAAHPSGAQRFASIEVAADERTVRDWFGDELPVRVVDGDPGVRAVAIAGARGELVLRP